MTPPRYKIQCFGEFLRIQGVDQAVIDEIACQSKKHPGDASD